MYICVFVICKGKNRNILNLISEDKQMSPSSSSSSHPYGVQPYGNRFWDFGKKNDRGQNLGTDEVRRNGLGKNLNR